jgi:2-polyprenyl-3-methyl-5-hydroxy-6-metoxy-1,4-benzoquinol methylase
MEIANQKQHWENVFINKEPNEVSWFQEYPKTSMEFLHLFDLSSTANIIDVGAGDSKFVDALLEKGFTNIWVLDISSAALEKAKKRLGAKADLVHWVVTDITEFEPPVQYDFWHDRAAFHFLTDDASIKKYVTITELGIRNNGYLILGTFSENGPLKCSGLEIKQYSAASMSGRFEKKFDRIRCIEETHTTPFSTKQNFLFCSFQKRNTKF